jgi:hypothetical protein
MARPKASDTQHLRAYELWIDGQFGPTAIHQTLKKEFEATDGVTASFLATLVLATTCIEYEKVVSLRTVKNWLREFRELRKGVTRLDEAFEWHRLDEYGLPWEAGAYILDTCSANRRATKYWQILTKELEEPVPTVRQVRWCWRVHLALPEVDGKDIILWAEAFVRYELLRDVLGNTVDMAGITAYLSHKPWTSDKSKEEYTKAVVEGRIPRLSDIWEDLVSLITADD